MNRHESKEWWRWQLYRCMAEYIHEPCHVSTARLRLLLDSYRYFMADDRDHTCSQMDWRETTMANNNHSAR